MFTHNTKSAPLDLISKFSRDEVLKEGSKYNFKLILLYIQKLKNKWNAMFSTEEKNEDTSLLLHDTISIGKVFISSSQEFSASFFRVQIVQAE
jgi:hypothetical protein